MISRREFASVSAKGLLAVAAVSSLMLGGCVSLPDLINIIAAALTSLGTLVAPYLPAGGSALLANVKAALADLSGAIQQYDAAPASDKATLLAKVDLFLNAFTTNFQGFISQVLPGAGAIVALIEGLASLILSTIAGIRGGLPNPPAAMRTMRIGSMQVVPKAMDAKQFKAAFNALCAANGQAEAELQ
jgi:hypothetical protein